NQGSEVMGQEHDGHSYPSCCLTDRKVHPTSGVGRPKVMIRLLAQSRKGAKNLGSSALISISRIESGPRRRGWRLAPRAPPDERLEAGALGREVPGWLDWRFAPRGCRLQKVRQNREQFAPASTLPKSIAKTDRCL